MSAREFAEWAAFYQMEPFGNFRDNWHAAMIANILANSNRARGKPPFRMSEFMWTDPVDAQKRRDAQTLAWLEAKADRGTDA